METIRIRATLERMKSELSLSGPAGSGPVVEAAPEVGYSDDLSDLGSRTSDVERTCLFAASQRRSLVEIDAALERLSNGNYGLCETCGKHIGVTRLEALPTARICIRCQRDAEATTSRFVRHRAV